MTSPATAAHVAEITGQTRREVMRDRIAGRIETKFPGVFTRRARRDLATVALDALAPDLADSPGDGQPGVGLAE